MNAGLETNAERTKHMIISYHPYSGQNQNVGIANVANELFENVAKFKYLGTPLTNQNDIHDEVNSSLNSENAIIQSKIFCLSIKKN
jgi:hypothetical protein